MATGRISVSAKLSLSSTRTGVLATAVPIGFEIPGLDLTGCVANYGIRISNLQNGAASVLSWTTGDVTENGATSTDEGVDSEGRDLGTIVGVILVAVIAPSSNDDTVTVSGNLLNCPIPPGGFVILAMPGGVGGSALSDGLTVSADATGDEVTIYAWNQR